MSKLGGILIAVGSTVLLVLAIVVGIFSSQNTAIAKENMIVEQLDRVATVQNEMFDSLEALVASVKDYKNYEGETLRDIVAARVTGNSSEAIAKNSETLAKANEQAKIYINAVHEAYPELKAADLYKEYMTAVQRYNSKVATTYNAYSRAVREYRVYTRAWPRRNFWNINGYEVKEFEDLYDGSSVKLPNKDKPKTFGD